MAALAVLLGSGTVLAQQPVPADSPFQRQGAPSAITTPQGRAQSDSMLTTKPAAGAGLPWQAPAPVAVTAPGTQATPAPIPFGRSTASQYQPIPEGPHTATAVPVENIDAIETSEPAPAVAVPLEADPVNEDPAEPTELTAPIFAPQEVIIPRKAVVHMLNKVTARAQRLEIKPADTVKAGKIEIRASHCQRSAENSLADAAALIEIWEILPDAQEPKQLFAGWMYQSSPSVNALEHPVYDVTLLSCQDMITKEKPKDTAKKPKKN